MKKNLLLIAGGVAVVLLVLVIVLPLFVNVNEYRPKIESEVSDSLGRKVQIGGIHLSILSGGIAMDDLSVADDPAFSREPFLRAKSVSVGVELLPLIFSRTLRIKSFTIERPEVSLVRNASGTWNFSSLGASTKKKSADPSSSAGTDISVQHLALSGGRVNVRSAGSRASHVYEDVKLEVTNLSETTEFPFQLSGKPPGNGTLRLEGKAGPLNRGNAEETPLHGTLDVRRLDLGATGFLDSSSGMAGNVNLTGDFTSDGHKLEAKGKVRAEKLQLVKGGTPCREAVEVTYGTDYDLKKETGVLQQGDIQIGKALARLTGSYNASGETATLQMKLDGQRMPAQDLQALLPALGAALPSGATLKGGTTDVALSISGPVNRLVISGPVSMADARLTGFNIGSKLGALASFAGLKSGGSDTMIQRLSTSLRIASEGIRVDNLSIVAPSIGTLTGNGTISPSQALNFHMVAQPTGGAANSALGGLASLTSGGKKGSSQVPFMIQGTTSSPVFLPDVAGAMGNMLKSNIPGQSDVGGALGGLFGKKKKP
jgi:AsmA protein